MPVRPDYKLWTKAAHRADHQAAMKLVDGISRWLDWDKRQKKPERALLLQTLLWGLLLVRRFRDAKLDGSGASVNADDLSSLALDCFIHFDFADGKAPSPWNITEYLRWEVRATRAGRAFRPEPNPFRGFRQEMRRAQAGRFRVENARALMRAWAALSSALGLCVAGCSLGAKHVRFEFGRGGTSVISARDPASRVTPRVPRPGS